LKHVGNLISGSGFVALLTHKSLKGAGQKILVADPSKAIRVNEFQSEEPEYQPENTNKTAQPGGGSWFFLGGVNFPLETIGFWSRIF
jgi:hypothetical protein